MAPATHGSLVSNEYTLNAHIQYDISCVCFKGEVLSISVPMTVVPRQDLEINEFPEPEGYAPQ